MSAEIIDADGAVICAADLAALPRQINEAVREAEGHASLAVQAALKAGALLMQAKELVPHGQWESWLTENCTLAPRTARAYAAFAKRLPQLSIEERQRVADLPLREAIQAISTSPTAPPRVTGYARPERTDRERTLGVLKAGVKAVNTVASDVRYGRVKRAKIASTRIKLMAAVAELDRMLEDAK